MEETWKSRPVQGHFMGSIHSRESRKGHVRSQGMKRSPSPIWPQVWQLEQPVLGLVPVVPSRFPLNRFPVEASSVVFHGLSLASGGAKFWFLWPQVPPPPLVNTRDQCFFSSSVTSRLDGGTWTRKRHGQLWEKKPSTIRKDQGVSETHREWFSVHSMADKPESWPIARGVKRQEWNTEDFFSSCGTKYNQLKSNGCSPAPPSPLFVIILKAMLVGDTKWPTGEHWRFLRKSGFCTCSYIS